MENASALANGALLKNDPGERSPIVAAVLQLNYLACSHFISLPSLPPLMSLPSGVKTTEVTAFICLLPTKTAVLLLSN